MRSSLESERRSRRAVFPTLAFFLVLLLSALFLSDPERYAKSILDGISLWAAAVLPAAFPFLFLTALLTALPPFFAFSKKISPAAGRIFRVSGAGAGAAILASVSGYPVGAKLYLDLHQNGLVNHEERFRLACLVTTSGPPFLVGTVGSMMYQSPALGWILLLSHLSGVWLVCLLMRCLSKPAQNASSSLRPPLQNPTLLYDSLWGAVVSVLCVGGFIALFCCFGEMLSALGVFSLFGGSPFAEGILRGLLEMTTGCSVLSNIKTPLSAATSCALVTFGGFCVLCQEIAYLSRAGIKTLPFVLCKLLQALFAFAICFLLSSLLL